MSDQENEAGAGTPASYEQFLAFARECVDHGTPVFVAPPATVDDVKRGFYGEFRFPSWPALEPSQEALDAWRPGWMAGAVCGVQFDVLDVDPRNGGDKSLAWLIKAELLPPVYGIVRTPSGGLHYYIARTGFRKCTPLKGIDLQAGDATGEGRGFVYITPTVRKGRTYEVLQPIDWEGIKSGADHPDAQPFLNFLVHRVGQNWVEAPPAPRWAGEHSDRDAKYLAVALENICAEVAAAPPGSQNNTLNAKAYKVGQIVAGCGLDANEATKALVRAGLSMRSGDPKRPWTDRDVRAVVNRSMRDGYRKPLVIGPFTEEARQEAERRAGQGVLNREIDAYLDNYDAITEAHARGLTSDQP